MFIHSEQSISGFIGNSDFALSNSAATPYDNILYLWYWVFCAASTTILVGSVAERCTFISYVLFVTFYSCWVRPTLCYMLGFWSDLLPYRGLISSVDLPRLCTLELV